MLDQSNSSVAAVLDFYKLQFSKCIITLHYINFQIQFDSNYIIPKSLHHFFPARSQPSNKLPRVVQLYDGSLDILWPGLAGSSDQSLH